jgi:PST family polysaccharide transporter
MMMIGLLGIIVKNADYFFIGMYFDARLLGIYVMGFTLIDHTIMALCWAASQALFPAFSRMQSDNRLIREHYTGSLSILGAITLPAGIGIALVADPLIHTLLGATWVEAVPVVQALAFYAVIYSLGFNIGDIYKATGKAHILTIITAVNIAVALPLLWLSTRWGLTGVALAQVIVACFITGLNWIVANRLIGIGMSSYWKALRSPLFATLAMSGTCLLLAAYVTDWAAPLALAALVTAGAMTYLAVMFMLSPETFRAALQLFPTRNDREKTTGGTP